MPAEMLEWLAEHVDWQQWTEGAKLLGGGLAMGLGAIGAGVGEGYNTSQVLDAMSRQPAVSGSLVRTMLVGQALAETSGIFALVIAFILIFGTPEGSMEMAGALVGSGLAMGLGAIGPAIGAGNAAAKAATSIGRNPRCRGKVTITMLLGQGLSTSPAVFALLISVLLVFGQQFGKYMGSNLVAAVTALSAGLCMGLGALGPGLGIGMAAASACDGVGKNPDQHSTIDRVMLIGSAVSSSTSIYAFVISCILMFLVTG